MWIWCTSAANPTKTNSPTLLFCKQEVEDTKATCTLLQKDREQVDGCLQGAGRGAARPGIGQRPPAALPLSPPTQPIPTAFPLLYS